MANFYGGPRGLAGPKGDKGDPGEVTLEYANNTFANAIKGVVSGVNAVRIDDISSVPHNIEVNAKRINLLSSPFGEIKVEEGKNYTISVGLKEGIELPESYTYSLAWYTSDGQWWNAELLSSGNELESNTYTFTVGAEGYHNYHINCVGLTEDMFEYAQLEEGIVATAPTPYVDTISFKTYGKNLIDYDVNTTNWEVAGNGRVFYFNVPCVSTFSIKRIENKGTIILERSTDNFVTDDENVAQASVGKEFMPCVIAPGYKYRVYTTKATVDGKFIECMQLEAGTKATEYEPYKEPTEYAISADGTVEGVTAIYPTTTIVAPGARIEVKYNVDTKKYIDNKFSELQATLVNLI